MPQASSDLQQIIIGWFGSIDDYGPSCVLLSKGWTEKAGMWYPPSPSYWGPWEDYVLLKFLRDEWDYSWQCTSLPN